MEPEKKSRRKLFLVGAVLALTFAGWGLWSTYTTYNPSPLGWGGHDIPEASGANGLPSSPREHVMGVLDGLDLTAGQWAELARLGPPQGSHEEREAHAQKVAAVLNDEQRAAFAGEMQKLHEAIIAHMTSKLSPEDQQAFRRRLERNPDYAPGPPRAFLTADLPGEPDR